MSNELEGTMNEPTDLDLVDLAKAGDIEAFTRLARRYQKRIYRTVLSMVRNHEDADDLAQDAFLQAFKSIDKFKKESGFYTWIYRIAVNVTLNHLKKRAKEKNHEEFDPEKAVRTGSFDALGQSPEKKSLRRELGQKLQEAIHSLPLAYRTSFILVEFENMSHGQAAHVLRCSENTISWRMHKARKMLQSQLKPYLEKSG